MIGKIMSNTDPKNLPLNSLKTQLEVCLSGLESFVEVLNSHIDESNVIQQYCCKIPEVDFDDENTIVDDILVESNTDELSALTSRVPGIISVMVISVSPRLNWKPKMSLKLSDLISKSTTSPADTF